jgi:hypothetical protein
MSEAAAVPFKLPILALAKETYRYAFSMWWSIGLWSPPILLICLFVFAGGELIPNNSGIIDQLTSCISIIVVILGVCVTSIAISKSII